MKIALALVIAALATGCAVQSSPEESQQPTQETQEENISVAAAELKISEITLPKWEPFETEGFSTCNNESYAFKGKMLNFVHTRTDGDGGLHVTTILAVKGTGVGNDTGARYVTFEGGFTKETYLASGETDIFQIFKGRLITPDPNVPDEKYDLYFHLHIEADGSVTTQIERFTQSCN